MIHVKYENKGIIVSLRIILFGNQYTWKCHIRMPNNPNYAPGHRVFFQYEKLNLAHYAAWCKGEI